VAVVGESGAGKSLMAHAVLGLLPKNARVRGDIWFNGKPLTSKRMSRLRGRDIALVPQAVSYLNPLWRVGGQVQRAAQLSGNTRAASRAKRDEAFARYGLAASVKQMFPFQISGGMARRILTATATVGDARLIIADEPTSGLDAENSRISLSYLRDLADAGKGVLLITHDLDAALNVSDKVAVFQNGVTVETVDVEAFKNSRLPCHPYTRELFRALPQNDFTLAVNGRPSLRNGHTMGCAFYGGCPIEKEDCAHVSPPKKDVADGWVRCHHA
jgi:peptide/nickel transport system ATP-binding protein